MSTEDTVSSDSNNKNVKLDSETTDEINIDPDAAIEIEAEAVKLANEENELETIDEEELEQLRKDLIDAQGLAEKNQEEVLRARAEIENLRRRAERDIENAHKFAVEKFVNGLLPVMDSLEMGLSAASEQAADIEKLKEGTQLTLKMFADTVKKFGLETIDPRGEEFNPEYHQAMTMQESADEKPNTVLVVMQKGYLLHGRLIRPAMVVVSKAVSSSDSNNENSDNDTDDKVGTTIDEKA